MAEKREKPAGEIPKILHYIWLGPKPFPEKSVVFVKGWIDRHPGWTVRFWTDLGQAAPDDRMEVRVFEQFPLEDLKEIYYRCDNFGERSELLRYAVLISEGGIYLDHDLVCLKEIGPLREGYDFFCGMELLGKTILSSSVNPSPHLIGSTAQHPILKSARQWLIKEWDRLDGEFPGSDPTAVYNRVQHRGFRALGMGIKESPARSGRKDVVFPPDYFSLSDKKGALYAVHAHQGSWYKPDEGADSKVQRLLKEVKNGSESTFSWMLVLALVNGGLAAFLIYRFFSKQKRRRA